MQGREHLRQALLLTSSGAWADEANRQMTMACHQQSVVYV